MATVISSDSIQDLRSHKEVRTAQTERRDVFDYSEETITRLTTRIMPKSLSFDDQVRVHHHSIEQESKENGGGDDENSNPSEKENE